MDELERVFIKSRMEMILNNLRLQNSGEDIHTVENIRHRAKLIIEILHRFDDLDPDEINKLVKSIEQECIEFFKDKY